MTEFNQRDASRAVFKGDIEKFQQRIDAGVVNIDDFTENENLNWIHRATYFISNPINFDFLKYLIELGVNSNNKDSYGYTPLHYASRKKDANAILLLINAGADIELEDGDGITALQHTLLQKPFVKKATEVLLQHGADQYHLLSSREKTIRDFVETISHGEDVVISELFDKYDKKT